MSEDFRCGDCGTALHGLPRAFGFAIPDDFVKRGWHKRENFGEWARLRVFRGKDQFYLYGQMLFDVSDGDMFALTVWVRLDSSDLAQIIHHWDDPYRAALPPAHATLAVSIPGFDGSRGLRCTVHQQPPGNRPHIVLTGNDHPLERLQQDGMPESDFHRVAHLALAHG